MTTAASTAPRFHRPPWVPRALRLRSPRTRVSHHDLHHHTTVTGLGLLVAWGVWLCWAMVVVMALAGWWVLLVYYWLGIAVYLGARWTARKVVTIWADHHA